MRHFSTLSDQLLLALAVETTSIRQEAPYTPSLWILVLKPHVPRMFFALCVSHTKTVTLTHAAQRCWIQRRHRHAAELFGQVNNCFERAL